MPYKKRLINPVRWVITGKYQVWYFAVMIALSVNKKIIFLRRVWNNFVIVKIKAQDTSRGTEGMFPWEHFEI